MLKKPYLLSLFFMGHLWGNVSIAVLPFTGENVSDQHLETLSEVLRDELMTYDTLNVLDREDMIQTLTIHGIQSPPCFDHDCAVVAGLHLDTDFVASLNISYIGEVFVVRGRLYELETGRLINSVIYDHEYSIEGLLSVGLKNVALMLLSQRIPIPAHEMKDFIYLTSSPSGAKVRAGNKILDGVTPMAIDRVTVESQRIMVSKEAYEPFLIQGFPEEEENRVIHSILKPLDPSAIQGDVDFGLPMPDGIYITSFDGELSIKVPEGSEIMRAIEKGRYTLNSDQYIIKDASFKILPRKTTQINPILVRRETLENQIKAARLRRNLYLASALGLFIGRGYLEYSADSNYEAYLADPEKPVSLRKTVEEMDRAKPWTAGLATALIFPALYHQLKMMDLNRTLRGSD